MELLGSERHGHLHGNGRSADSPDHIPTARVAPLSHGRRTATGTWTSTSRGSLGWVAMDDQWRGCLHGGRRAVSVPMIASDGAGGAIVTWHDFRNPLDRCLCPAGECLGNPSVDGKWRRHLRRPGGAGIPQDRCRRRGRRHYYMAGQPRGSLWDLCPEGKRRGRCTVDGRRCRPLQGGRRSAISHDYWGRQWRRYCHVVGVSERRLRHLRREGECIGCCPVDV